MDKCVKELYDSTHTASPIPELLRFGFNLWSLLVKDLNLYPHCYDLGTECLNVLFISLTVPQELAVLLCIPASVGRDPARRSARPWSSWFSTVAALCPEWSECLSYSDPSLTVPQELAVLTVPQELAVFLCIPASVGRDPARRSARPWSRGPAPWPPYLQIGLSASAALNLSWPASA